MTDEEIKLRCIEIVANSLLRNDYPDVRHILKKADKFYKGVYPYIKEGKLPD